MAATSIEHAARLIAAAGMPATVQWADDPECEDDQINLQGDVVAVQVSAYSRGLFYTPTVHGGEGADFWMAHGKETRDPVEAARAAFELARKHGVA